MNKKVIIIHFRHKRDLLINLICCSTMEIKPSLLQELISSIHAKGVEKVASQLKQSNNSLCSLIIIFISGLPS
uniref:Uncharacterized protein MANES_17G020100 n=1 Tax=Rhizophora mucronata TaxID=61149 RepID=A0A2P2IVW7_RHIMU